MAASIGRILADICELEEPLEGLRSLRSAVLAVPVERLRETVSELRLGVIFNLLDSNDREQIDLCVVILGHILQALDPIHLANNCRSELHAGLRHRDDSVRVLAISQVGRIVTCPEAVTHVVSSQDLLVDVIHCVGQEQISISNEAIRALSKLSHSKAGLDALFQSRLLGKLKDVMALSDVVRYRVYELIVDMASFSPLSLGYCANASFLSQLLDELTGNDVLVRATAIEMVTALAHSPHGRQYLSRQGIMDKISHMITEAESDPLSGFYLPGLVKFFGNLAIMDSPQQVCESYPVFLKKVFEMVMDQDAVKTGVALDTLGVLGSTVEGKQVLQKSGETFLCVLRRMSNVASNSSTELRVRCLDALSLLLALPAEQQTEDLLGLTETWFGLLSGKPVEMLRDISIQPFPELHCGALRVFTAIAGQPWGQKQMIAAPGFVEFITNRTTAPGKESKDARFELVKALVASSSTAEIFGNQQYLRLREYLREGPYYVTAVSAVSVEGAD